MAGSLARLQSGPEEKAVVAIGRLIEARQWKSQPYRQARAERSAIECYRTAQRTVDRGEFASNIATPEDG